MRILLTGSSGLIGRHLHPLLRSAGHDVVRLRRTPAAPPDPGAVYVDLSNPAPGALDLFDAVIHLAGENVARRWTAARRQSILASRADFTSNLCAALAQAANPPAHFLCASGIGYYGYDREGLLTEDSPQGTGFLADVCRQWESATQSLITDNTTPPPRIALLRIAAVLSPEGGALAELLPPFRLGLGGVMGSGRQYMSWISLPDLLAAILHVLHRPSLSGPVNLTSPTPVTNRAFTQALAHALHRPAFFKIPAAALKLAFGRMAAETILASQRAVPEKLPASGFSFRHETLDPALRDLLAGNPR